MVTSISVWKTKTVNKEYIYTFLHNAYKTEIGKNQLNKAIYIIKSHIFKTLS